MHYLRAATPTAMALMGMAAYGIGQGRTISGFEANNRSISLQGLTLQQDYREIDTQGLTADGILNTEKGHWQGNALQARWQGQLPIGTTAMATRLPLWLQAQTAQATGQTDYNGYLQSGNTLTPYRAKTGNTWRSHSVALGVPLALALMQIWACVAKARAASVRTNSLAYAGACKPHQRQAATPSCKRIWPVANVLVPFSHS